MTERWHDRLPWYVNGTLDAKESVMFQKHLESCATCQDELHVLESLRSQIERHGEDFLRTHPPPEQLLALIEPGEEPLIAETAEAVRRHLAICATCAEESSWLRGEAVPEVAHAGASSEALQSVRGSIEPGGRLRNVRSIELRRSRFLLTAAATLAAAALLAIVFVVRRSGTTSLDPLVRQNRIDATTRSEAKTRVLVPADERTVHLYFETESTAASPLTLEIRGAQGDVLLRRDGIVAEDLLDGRFLFMDLPRSRFPDGEYVARLIEAQASEPPTEYPFRIVGGGGS